MQRKRVVITGMGALTPIGNNLNEYWQGLIAGESGAGAITKFDTTHFKTKFACELKNLNLEDHFDRKFIRKNDPFTLYALIATREAVANSNIENTKYNKDRSGVIWASGNGGVSTFDQQMLDFSKTQDNPRFSPFFIPKILIDTPSGAIALENGLRGINYCTVSACASSTSAIMDAFNYISWGKADVMICGGSEAPITQSTIAGFNALKALSTKNDNPQTACRPLDVNRDGFVMGEGAGALVLEEYEHAKQRGAKIYAEVVGAGMSNDAYHATATHPDGVGAQLAIQSALDEAGITINDIDYINLHATSTPVGDVSEIKALKGLGANQVQASATKSMTGHLLGAAGAIEAIACIKAIEEGVIPPTINTTKPGENVPEFIDLTLGEPKQQEINYAMSNTFGFGGHNAIAIFAMSKLK